MSKKTLVSFVLDETGSMQNVKQATIAGFNEYVGTLRENGKGVRFTLTQFNSDKVKVMLNNVKMRDVPDLTDETYQPSSLTPLYDAIGQTIRSAEEATDGKKRNVLVVIQTDGHENDSREFTRQSIFNLIQEKKKAGWTFVFLGADQDAWEVGQQLGLDRGNVSSYDSAETAKTFTRVATATMSYVSRGGKQTDDFWEDEKYRT
jgi:Mg-chelatase subunit ChlD